MPLFFESERKTEQGGLGERQESEGERERESVRYNLSLPCLDTAVVLYIYPGILRDRLI